MAFIFSFCLYCHHIQMPKNLLKLKASYGAEFPQSEKKGVFIPWMEEDYVDEIYGDIFRTEKSLIKQIMPN